MTNGRKGSIVGAVAILAVTLGWGIASGTGEGNCLDVPGGDCQCYPAASEGLLLGALVVGVPWGIVVGGFIGNLAGSLKVYRRPMLALAVLVIALLLAAITIPVMHCSTDPQFFARFACAFVVLAISALALERWTGEADRLPLARLR